MVEEHGRKLLNQLTEKGVELRGDQVICGLEPQAKQAEEADWGAEYLAPILSVKTVQDVQEAIIHSAVRHKPFRSHSDGERRACGLLPDRR